MQDDIAHMRKVARCVSRIHLLEVGVKTDLPVVTLSDTWRRKIT